MMTNKECFKCGTIYNPESRKNCPSCNYHEDLRTDLQVEEYLNPIRGYLVNEVKQMRKSQYHKR